MGFKLFFYQVLLGNHQLFIFGVTWQFKNFHPVAQRPGNGVKNICRGDKHYPGKIKRDFHVMIGKGKILLRVEDFKQS